MVDNTVRPNDSKYSALDYALELQKQKEERIAMLNKYGYGKKKVETKKKVEVKKVKPTTTKVETPKAKPIKKEVITTPKKVEPVKVKPEKKEVKQSELKPVVKVRKPKTKKMPKSRMNFKVNKTTKTLLILAALGLGGFVLYKSFGEDFIAKKKTEAELKRLLNNQETAVVEIKEDNKEPIKEEQEVVVEEEPVIPEDIEMLSSELFNNYNFDKSVTPSVLKGLNPVLSDNTSWIEIPGTNISYPVVHPKMENIDKMEGFRDWAANSSYDLEDYLNRYYLKHTITDMNSDWGTIYIDYRNEPVNQHTNKLDDVTRIYGHQMQDGSMFSQLKKYKDPKFLEDHSMGVLYTDDGLCYKMDFVAARLIDGSNDYDLPFNFDTVEDKQAWIDSYLEAASKDGFSRIDSIEVDEDTKFIATVTCSYERQNLRLVEIWKLTKCRIQDFDYTSQGYYDKYEYQEIMRGKVK